MTQSNQAAVGVRAHETSGKPSDTPQPGGDPRIRARYHASAAAARGRDAQRSGLLHVVESREEISSGWLLTEAPPPAGLMWQQVAPAAGEAPNWVAWLAMSTAGLFRAVAVTGLWVLALSVSTRTRAGVGLIVVVLVTSAGLIVRALNP